MASTVLSAAILGIDAYPIHVEVDTDRTLPTVTVVGLPDSTVREAATGNGPLVYAVSTLNEAVDI